MISQLRPFTWTAVSSDQFIQLTPSNANRLAIDSRALSLVALKPVLEPFPTDVDADIAVLCLCVWAVVHDSHVDLPREVSVHLLIALAADVDTRLVTRIVREPLILRPGE